MAMCGPQCIKRLTSRYVHDVDLRILTMVE